jgi:hypothetical protein
MTKEILENGDEVRARTEILKTDDPAALEGITQRMLGTLAPNAPNDWPNLPPLKRQQIAASAENKRIELHKAGMVKQRQEQTDAANARIRDFETRSTPASKAEVDTAIKETNATPAQINAMQAASQQKVEQKTNADGKAVQQKVMRAMELPALPMQGGARVAPEVYTQMWDDEANEAYSKGNLSLNDRDDLLRKSAAWRKNIFHGEDFNSAVSYIRSTIGTYHGDDDRAKDAYPKIVQQWTDELYTWRPDNLKASPLTWAREQTTRFRAMTTDVMYQKLAAWGGHLYLRRTPEGDIDTDKTVAAIEAARKSGALVGRNYEKSLSIITKVINPENKP